jgi:hypothetical protein
MDRAEFRQRAMIAAMQGLLANPHSWDMDMMSVTKISVQYAEALLEANTIDETEEQEA